MRFRVSNSSFVFEAAEFFRFLGQCQGPPSRSTSIFGSIFMSIQLIFRFATKDAYTEHHLVVDCYAPTTSISKLPNVQLNDLEWLERTPSAYVSQGHVDPCLGYMYMCSMYCVLHALHRSKHVTTENSEDLQQTVAVYVLLNFEPRFQKKDETNQAVHATMSMPLRFVSLESAMEMVSCREWHCAEFPFLQVLFCKVL